MKEGRADEKVCLHEYTYIELDVLIYVYLLSDAVAAAAKNNVITFVLFCL